MPYSLLMMLAFTAISILNMQISLKQVKLLFSIEKCNRKRENCRMFWCTRNHRSDAAKKMHKNEKLQVTTRSLNVQNQIQRDK